MVGKLFDVVGYKQEFLPVVGAVAEGFARAQRGETDQFFYNIDHYLNLFPQSKMALAESGYSKVLSLANDYAWKGAKPELSTPDEYDYMSIFDVVSTFVVVGVDMEGEGYPSALYTRNIELLDSLAAEGQLDVEAYTKVKANLTGAKTYKSIKDGNFVLARLDVVGQNENGLLFKPMTPKSNLEIGLGKRFVALPVPFMHLFADTIEGALSFSPFSFTKSSADGQRSYNAALNRDIVRMAYKGSPAEQVEAKIKRLNPGYNVAKQRYYAYDLESSVHGMGVVSFRPEMLDSLTQVGYDKIDTSRHNVDFSILRSIFATRIRGLKAAQLDKFQYIDLSSYANVRDKQQAIIEASEKERDKNLYFLMKANPEIFGDLDEALEKRERLIPKFMKSMQFIDLPVSQEDRLTLIRDLLKTGVVKFTSITKSGSMIARVVTDSTVVLERMLGKDYVKNFESIRNKLYHLLKLVENGEIKDRKTLETISVEYNVLDYVDQTVYFSPAIDSGDVTDVIAAIKAGIEVLKEKSANRSIPEGAVLYRNVDASNPNDFFGNVNVNNILTLEYAKA